MAPSNCNATVDLPSKWQPGTPAHGAHAILHGAGRPLGPSFATLNEAPIVNGLVSTDRKRNNVNNTVKRPSTVAASLARPPRPPAPPPPPPPPPTRATSPTTRPNCKKTASKLWPPTSLLSARVSTSPTKVANSQTYAW